MPFILPYLDFTILTLRQVETPQYEVCACWVLVTMMLFVFVTIKIAIEWHTDQQSTV